MTEPRVWVSKELDHTDTITAYQIGNVKVVEIVTVHKLDELLEEYKKSKDKTRKKEIKEQFANIARELNSKYKKDYFLDSL